MGLLFHGTKQCFQIKTVPARFGWLDSLHNTNVSRHSTMNKLNLIAPTQLLVSLLIFTLLSMRSWSIRLMFGRSINDHISFVRTVNRAFSVATRNDDNPFYQSESGILNLKKCGASAENLK